MRTYIELNTNMRKKAQNEFEKDFFKLMSNAPYGKFIENIRKRSNIELILNNNKVINNNGCLGVFLILRTNEQQHFMKTY